MPIQSILKYFTSRHHRKKNHWVLFAFSDDLFTAMHAEITASGVHIQKIEIQTLKDKNWQTCFLRFIGTLTELKPAILWILQPQQYQLQSSDDLPVPDEELSQAALWRAQELLEVPAEDILVDAYRIPPHGPGAQRKMIQIIVTQKKLVLQVMELIQGLSLDIDIIDVSELALRRIAKTFCSKHAFAAHLALHPFASQWLITEEEDLYFSRLFNRHYQNIKDIQNVDELLLQIQRSWDYYRSQYAKPLPTGFCLSPGLENHVLVEKLQENFNLPVITTDWKNHFPLLEMTTDQQHAMHLLLAGLLRL